MIFVCVTGPAGANVGAWYYSTATSLDLQDRTAPQMILKLAVPGHGLPGRTNASFSG